MRICIALSRVLYDVMCSVNHHHSFVWTNVVDWCSTARVASLTPAVQAAHQIRQLKRQMGIQDLRQEERVQNLKVVSERFSLIAAISLA